MDTATLVPLVVTWALAVTALGLLVAALHGRRQQQPSAPARSRAAGPAASDERSARRRDGVQVRDLPPAHRRRFQARWRQVQEDFVERPDAAVDAAHALVTEVLRERGYPVDERGVVPFDPTEVMVEYRSAQRIAALNDRGEATTDQLRQALVHYRSLFGRLLDTGEGRGVGQEPLRQEPYPDEPWPPGPWPRSSQRR
ncbi:MAG TPA: hypothetical protein VNU26_00895 [Mycobacteriales bacterium]|nr:hypothetical protein [Mycobacteriales bacterium]